MLHKDPKQAQCYLQRVGSGKPALICQHLSLPACAMTPGTPPACWGTPSGQLAAWLGGHAMTELILSQACML